MVKFIHAADLHIDRSFEGLPLLNERVQKKFLTANHTMLERIVKISLLNKVDFVLFAGDTFHQNRPSLKMQQVFFKEMKKLEAENIPVYLIFGNHDYYQEERYWFEFPKNVHLYKNEQVETKYFTTKNDEKIAISGFSYQHPWIQEDMVRKFPVREQVDYHIGLYHGEVGKAGTSNYAPFTISQMKEKGYDYWALGHIHVPTMLNKKPIICYSGAPQGHTQKEEKSTSIMLVNLESEDSNYEKINVADVIWSEQTISLEAAKKSADVFQVIQSSLDENDSPLVLLQIRLVDYDHLSTEALELIRTGEVLEYLMEEMRGPNKNIIIWRIVLKEQEISKKINVPVSNELLNELLQTYADPMIFKQELKELYTHPEAIRVLNELDEYQSETLRRVHSVLQEDFSFGDDRL
ncbi:MAG: exonuclease SbcCD subunit D [Enterococcus sp.]